MSSTDRYSCVCLYASACSCGHLCARSYDCGPLCASAYNCENLNMAAYSSWREGPESTVLGEDTKIASRRPSVRLESQAPS